MSLRSANLDSASIASLCLASGAIGNWRWGRRGGVGGIGIALLVTLEVKLPPVGVGYEEGRGTKVDIKSEAAELPDRVKRV